MNKNDASVIKILAELGLGKETKSLTPDEEELYRYATDDDYRFTQDVKKVYSQPQTNEKK